MGAIMPKPKNDKLLRASSVGKELAIPQPEIPRLDSPHPGWKRLSIAPFHYQAEDWNDQIYAADWQWMLRQFEQKFPIQRLDMDKDLGVLLVEFPPVVNSRRVETRATQCRVYPASVRASLFSFLEMGTWEPLPDGFGYKFACAVEDLWRSMESGFRDANRGGFCRIVARIGSPVDAKFTEITPDSFAHFKITDWYNGVATTSSGYEIFSIHAADPAENQPYVSSPLQAHRATLSKRPVMAWVVAYVLKRYPEGKDRLSYDALTFEIGNAMKDANRLKPDERTVREGYKLAMKIAPYIRATGKIGILGLPDFPLGALPKSP